MRVARVEQPRDGVARAARGVQRGPVGAQARMGLEGVGAGDRQEVAAALV